MVGLSLIIPRSAICQSGPNRKILVVIELLGGNDGFNTVIPFTDARYHSLRPVLSFNEEELKDDAGHSMILSERLGLHPKMSGIKQLYDAGKVAVLTGVGYPNPNGSHFQSQDIWHTGRLDGKGEGWLGKYVSKTLADQNGLIGFSLANFRLPGTLRSNRVTIPNISKFESFGLQVDARYPGNSNIRTNALSTIYRRSLPQGSQVEAISRTASETFRAFEAVKAAIEDDGSSVVYPDDNPLAQALKAIAAVTVSIPEASLLYVQFGQFDTHARQIESPSDKLSGIHALQLQQFSEAVRLFHNDLTERGLADKVLMLQWSEFGRRPQENRSLGTDHGSASSLFIIGNPVRGGLYGEQPSLEAASLDDAGNAKFTVDFRSVYATILNDWLETDSQDILGARFENIGFLS